VTCGIIHVLTSARFAMAIRDELYCHSSSEQNPVLYFEIGRSMMTFVYMSAYMYTVWKNMSLFCSIINDLERLKYLNVNRKSWFCRRVT